jgi:hypothetical protein
LAASKKFGCPFTAIFGLKRASKFGPFYCTTIKDDHPIPPTQHNSSTPHDYLPSMIVCSLLAIYLEMFVSFPQLLWPFKNIPHPFFHSLPFPFFLLLCNTIFPWKH